jgi:hypothetical protein
MINWLRWLLRVQGGLGCLGCLWSFGRPWGLGTRLWLVGIGRIPQIRLCELTVVGHYGLRAGCLEGSDERKDR